MRAALGSRNRKNTDAVPRPLRHHPGDGDLRQSGTLFARDSLDFGKDRGIALDVARLKARHLMTAISFRKIRGTLELSRQQATAERRVGHESSSDVSARGKIALLLRLAREQRILHL